MIYEMPPYRPPNEGRERSLLLRVTRGCPWNRCAFCGMYKRIRFQIRSVEEVKEDILKARRWYMAVYGMPPMTAFIGDSDTPIIRASDFAEILRFLRSEIPTIARVTSYARAKTIYRKRWEHLLELREAGLSRLHMGLESGSKEVLARVNKGATPQEMIEAAAKAKEAGFEVSEYVIIGLGGRELSEEHAEETARVLNEINPHFIRFRTLVPLPGTPVYEWYMSDEFQLLTPHEALREALRIVEKLEVSSVVCFDHVSNPYPVQDAKFPEEKRRLIQDLKLALTLDRRQLTDVRDLMYRGYL